jgi:hypothetical protein
MRTSGGQTALRVVGSPHAGRNEMKKKEALGD